MCHLFILHEVIASHPFIYIYNLCLSELFTQGWKGFVTFLETLAGGCRAHTWFAPLQCAFFLLDFSHNGSVGDFCSPWLTEGVWQWQWPCCRFVALPVTSCTPLARQTHQLTQMYKSQTSSSWALFLGPSCLFGHQPASWEESTRGKLHVCLWRKQIWHTLKWATLWKVWGKRDCTWQVLGVDILQFLEE